MSAAYSRSSMKSKQPPPSARHARPRAPGPSEPHGSGLQVRICSSSCLSWLHLLKSWSLRQSWGGSLPVLDTHPSANAMKERSHQVSQSCFALLKLGAHISCSYQIIEDL